ncbi:MAG: ArnT family glycosyltransferase [Rhodanobacteraceae bacterium]
MLPLAVLFPPIPIDETHYLTAAWEMYNCGQWLVPTVNGARYSDKSPLLFWLIAGGRKIVRIPAATANCRIGVGGVDHRGRRVAYMGFRCAFIGVGRNRTGFDRDAGRRVGFSAGTVRPEAECAGQALHRHVAIVHVEWNNGLFGYTGRLKQPVPWIPRTEMMASSCAHPHGMLSISDRHDDPKNGVPFKSWPYFRKLP